MATLRPDFQVSPYLLDNPVPPAIEVTGVQRIDYDTVYARAGDDLTWLIEAVVPPLNDIGGQMKLDLLLDAAAGLSLKEAAEADRQLTSRLLDDGTVQTGQPAACSDLRVTTFNSVGRITLRNGVEVLAASWAVQVIT